jgi:hypothetical protein
MLKSHLILTFILCFSFCSGVDWQLRERHTFEKSLNEDLALVFAGEWRWKTLTGSAYQHLHDVGFDYTLSPSWKLGVFYRHTVRKTDDGWKSSEEPYINFTKTWKLSKTQLSNRHRFQYRSRNSDWLYRNKVSLLIPVERICKPISLYLTNEFFFLELDRFNLNRFESGFRVSFHSERSLTLSYQMEHSNEKNVGWKHAANILHIALKLGF